MFEGNICHFLFAIGASIIIAADDVLGMLPFLWVKNIAVPLLSGFWSQVSWTGHPFRSQ